MTIRIVNSPPFHPGEVCDLPRAFSVALIQLRMAEEWSEPRRKRRQRKGRRSRRKR